MLHINDKTITTTDEGYLINSHDWDIEVAHHLAQLEGIELNATNLHIVQFCRDFYLNFKRLPPIRVVVKELKNHFSDDVANSVYLQTTFPPSPARQIAKLAGLPKPSRCM